MRETDNHFSGAQLEALGQRGLSLTRTPWRRVRVATLTAPNLRITDDPPIPTSLIFADRDPKCPIVDQNETGQLVILPDGAGRWMRGFR